MWKDENRKLLKEVRIGRPCRKLRVDGLRKGGGSNSRVEWDMRLAVDSWRLAVTSEQ